jgi:hypothetical protein
MATASDARREALTIGVVTSGPTPPEWQHRVVAGVAAIDGVRAFAVPGPSSTAAAGPERAWALVSRRQRLLRSRALPVGDGASLPACDLVVDLTGAAVRRSPARARLAPGTADGFRYNAAESGVETWTVCDGARKALSEPFPGLAEIASGAGGAVCIHRIGEPHAIRRATFAASAAYLPDLDRLYQWAARVVAQAVRDRLNDVPGPGPSVVWPPPARGRRRPAGVQLMAGVGRAALSRARSWFREDSWMIGVVDAPIARALTEPLAPVQWLGERRSSAYLADPFGVPGERDRLYCEEFVTSTGVGKIKEIVVRDAHIHSARDVDLPHACHTSYPYLFEDGGSLYCVPEAIGDRRCLLLRLEDGVRWTPIAAPVEEGVAVADPTLFRWEGRYWLAYTDADDGPFDTLSLRYADRLTGPWRSHANNPVKVDHASARSAGTPFVHRGELFRPAQDCRGGYGRAVVIHRVTLCSPRGFREEPVRVLRPQPGGPNPDGLHTLSAWGERTLVDGCRYRLNPIALRRKLLSRIHKVFPRHLSGSAHDTSRRASGSVVQPTRVPRDPGRDPGPRRDRPPHGVPFPELGRP